MGFESGVAGDVVVVPRRGKSACCEDGRAQVLLCRYGTPAFV